MSVASSVRPEFVLVGHAEMTSDCLSDSTLLTRLVHFLHVESVYTSDYLQFIRLEKICYGSLNQHVTNAAEPRRLDRKLLIYQRWVIESDVRRHLGHLREGSATVGSASTSPNTS